MELSTYFRINAIEHGAVRAHANHCGCRQLRELSRRLHGAACATRTSCTPPSSSWSRSMMRTSNTRRCRTGIPAMRRARRHLQLRHQARRVPRTQFAHLVDAGGNRLGDHVEISELRAARRGLHRRVLFRRHGEQPAAGGHRHEDDPHRPGYAQHHRLEGHLRRARPEHLSRPGEGAAERAWRAQLHPVRLAADGRATAARTPSRMWK